MDRRVSEDTQITALEVDPSDYLDLVDRSDDTDAPTGTNKKILAADLADVMSRLSGGGADALLRVQPVKLVNAANYQLLPGDAWSLLRVQSGGTTITLPNDDTIAVGAWFEVVQGAGGQVTFYGAQVPAGFVATTRAQWSRVFAQRIAPTQWHVSGDLAST